MKYFSLTELTTTNTGLHNVPNAEQTNNLIYLVDNLLDEVRERYGKPIKVTSGFRSFAVNAKVGGKPTSQHCKGEAADLNCGSKAENKRIFDIIKEIGRFDQLINEQDFTWIHVSLKRVGNRKQILSL